MPDVRATLREIFGIDVRALAVLRISIGAIILVDLALQVPYLQHWYTDEGILPRVLAGPVGYLFSFFMWSGDLLPVYVLTGLLAVFALTLMLGFLTPVSSTVTWFLLTAMQERNTDLLNGGDVLLRMLLFWCMFLPTGACLSLDSRRGFQAVGDGKRVVSVASAALLLQWVFLYAFNGVHKFGPEWNEIGNAIELSIMGEYGRSPFRDVLLGMPSLVRAMSFGIPWFEIFAPLLILLPFRNAAVRIALFSVFLAFQAGLGFALVIHLFPFISIAASLPLLPGAFWDRLAARFPVFAAPETARVPGGIPQLLSNAVVGVLLGYSLLANFHSVGWMNLDKTARGLARMVGVVQHWHLYAPSPPSWDPVWKLPGRLHDQSVVDLAAEAPAEHWEDVPAVLRTFRMRRYFDIRVRPPKPGHREEAIVAWLCHEWNAVHEADRELERVRLLFEKRVLMERYGDSADYLLVEHACPTHPVIQFGSPPAGDS